MIKLLAAVVFFSFCYVVSFAQQLPEYDITATLNDRSRTIDGFVKVRYTNNTSDSVHYLWFNLYPNAFKSDRTAFSEYLIDKGRTDFYFSDPAKRGYINRLNFRAGDEILNVEDHPLYIDVLKVWLPSPLAPNGSIEISTPFHVKVPYNFDGIGYKFPSYQLKYWYPAIADSVKPLTNADESSNAFANYEIKLQLPSTFSVDSTHRNSSARVNDSVSVFHFTETNLKDFSLSVTKPYRLSKLPPPGAKQALSPISDKIKKLVSRPLLPAIGYNKYDGLQLGVIAQNLYKDDRYQYYIAPLYTFNSKSIAGIAGGSYNIPFNSKYLTQLEIGASGSTFAYNSLVDSLGEKVFSRLFKIAPYIKATLPSSSPKVKKTIDFRTFLLSERDFKFVRNSGDSLFYPAAGEYGLRFVNQLTFEYASSRVLYPYRAQLQFQQGLTFYRVNATGEYFFNYSKGGGMNVRLFAAKFGYIGSLSSSEKFKTILYQPKLTAVRGVEDYTYSNYFVGRSENDGLSGRQMMMRDGGLKIRTDLFSGLQGRSDDWIASVNFNTSLPRIFPVHVPVKLFLDAGTHAEAWDEENNNPRFMYVAGLQLSLFKNVLNIYAPVLYSKHIRDQLKTVDEGSKFSRTISFSLDFTALREYLSK